MSHVIYFLEYGYNSPYIDENMMFFSSSYLPNYCGVIRMLWSSLFEKPFFRIIRNSQDFGVLFIKLNVVVSFWPPNIGFIANYDIYFPFLSDMNLVCWQKLPTTSITYYPKICGCICIIPSNYETYSELRYKMAYSLPLGGIVNIIGYITAFAPLNWGYSLI